MINCIQECSRVAQNTQTPVTASASATTSGFLASILFDIDASPKSKWFLAQIWTLVDPLSSPELAGWADSARQDHPSSREDGAIGDRSLQPMPGIAWNGLLDVSRRRAVERGSA
jgi:hypothetical protein